MRVLTWMMMRRHATWLLAAAPRPRTASRAMLLLLLVSMWVLAVLLGLLLLGVRVLGVG
jgi:hypothetical protein